MNFNFDQIEKQRFGNGTIPDNTVRVSGGGITISENVIRRWNTEALPTGREKVYVNLAIDQVNQAIKLSAGNRENDFSFHATGGKTSFRSNIPKRVLNKLVVGDYVEHPEFHNVFILAK